MKKKIDSSTDQFKEMVGDTVADVLQEVVMPVLAGMHDDILVLKENTNILKENVEKLDNKVERINRSLILITDHQADKLDDHEKRIGKIEGTVNN